MASRLAVHTTAAATLILLAACAIDGAAASQTQNFRDCFRWDNQTNNFQGGSDWYKAEACKNWFWSAFGWTVPAFIGLFVLLVFPCVFYCARVCCNCCGGRHRTYGMCCADDSSRHRFPGYSNRTILLAKLLMCAAFGGYTYYAVGGYVSNAHFHNHLIDSLDSMSASVDSVRDDLQRTASEAATLSILPERIIPSAFAADIKNVADGFGDRVSDIQNVLDKIRRAEDNQSWGRAESVYRYPSCVLFCFLLALFMMLCNLRKAIGPLMVLICLTSIVEGLVFIPHMILAQAMTGMCDSYNQSVVPVVVSAVASQKGCNDPAFFTALNDSAKMGLQPLFWHDANSSWTTSSLCQDMQTVCSTYNCTYNTCGGASATGVALPFQRSGDPAAPFNIMAIQAVMETPFAKSTSPSAANVPPGTTIVSCAVSACPNGTAVQTAAINLMRFYKTSYASLLFLYESAYPDSYNCNAVRGFMHEPMESNVCTDLNRDATNVAMTTGILYLISFLSLPVLIRGMKRFVAMQRGQPLKEVLRDTVVYADARVNAIPVREYTYVEGSAQPLDINGGGGNVSCGGGGDDSHSPHSNYGTAGDEGGVAAGNGVSAARLGDAAYQRRFYGGFRAHGDADQPLINGDESMRTTDGNGIKQV